MKILVTPEHRNGLRESLEEFAARSYVSQTGKPVRKAHPDEARFTWRALGIGLLFPRPPYPRIVAASDGPRIAPGLAVPTKEVTVYEEQDQ